MKIVNVPFLVENAAYGKQILASNSAEEIYNIIQNFEKEDPTGFAPYKQLSELCGRLDRKDIDPQTFVACAKGIFRISGVTENLELDLEIGDRVNAKIVGVDQGSQKNSAGRLAPPSCTSFPVRQIIDDGDTLVLEPIDDPGQEYAVQRQLDGTWEHDGMPITLVRESSTRARLAKIVEDELSGPLGDDDHGHDENDRPKPTEPDLKGWTFQDRSYTSRGSDPTEVQVYILSKGGKKIEYHAFWDSISVNGVQCGEAMSNPEAVKAKADELLSQLSGGELSTDLIMQKVEYNHFSENEDPMGPLSRYESLRESNQFSPGDGVIFRLKGISAREFGYPENTSEELEELDGQRCTVSAVNIPGEGDSTGYYDVDFEDGTQMLAVSGFHLEKQTPSPAAEKFAAESVALAEDDFYEPKEPSPQDKLKGDERKLSDLLTKFADEQVGSDRARVTVYPHFGTIAGCLTLVGPDGKVDRRSEKSPESKREMQEMADEFIASLETAGLGTFEINHLSGSFFEIRKVVQP